MNNCETCEELRQDIIDLIKLLNNPWRLQLIKRMLHNMLDES